MYVFSVDCMHFSLFLDTLGYNFLHKYCIYILNIFRSAEGQGVPPHSFDIASDICVYISLSTHTPLYWRPGSVPDNFQGLTGF